MINAASVVGAVTCAVSRTTSVCAFAGLKGAIARTLIGHEPGDVHDEYDGEPPPMRELLKAISKIDPLKDSPDDD